MAVAADSSVVIVGAPHENGNQSSYAGNAYVFNPTSGALMYSLVSPNHQINGYFGYSVAAGGNVVVVGAVFEYAGYVYQAGHAYIFNAATGALVSTLTSPNAQTGGEFGYSVATNGNVVVVGAPIETVGGFIAAGHVYTFNAATGALITSFISPNAQSTGEFGSSVGASASTIVVGAPGENVGTTSRAGRAYTFSVSTGTLISSLNALLPQTNGNFGWSVAAGSKAVVVGAPYENQILCGFTGCLSFVGHVYTYDPTTGVLVHVFSSPSQQFYGLFGWFVATNGNSVVIGQPANADGSAGPGSAYAFAETSGSVTATYSSPNPIAGGQFGYSVGTNGANSMIGARYETAGGLPDAGHVYIF
jgi:hypothetical protein